MCFRLHPQLRDVPFLRMFVFPLTLSHKRSSCYASTITLLVNPGRPIILGISDILGISGGLREALGAIARSQKKIFGFYQQKRLKNNLILRFIIMIAPSPLH
jgi:hypothetical protein